jgi:hypothetical protein
MPFEGSSVAQGWVKKLMTDEVSPKNNEKYSEKHIRETIPG